jgi:molecular chaperone GrpE
VTKDEFKEFICNKIDLMDNQDIVELSNFLQNSNSEEKIVDELVSIKGEFKKLTKIVQSLDKKDEQDIQDIAPYITMYKFLENSREILQAMPKLSFFNILRVSESYGSFKSGFVSIDILFEQITNNIALSSSASVGERFNPDYHEVVERVEDRTLEDETIVEVIQQGFIYKEELINYAKVKVNKWK